MLQWHKSNLLEHMYVPMKGGEKIGMPRYYKDRIYNERERVDLSLHHSYQAELREKENILKLQQEHGDNWQKFILDRDLWKFEKMFTESLQNRKKI